jgi:hypothetical protein
MAKFDQALVAAGTSVNTTAKEAQSKLVILKKAAEVANKTIKVSRDSCAEQAKVLGGPDHDVKVGFEVLVKRLDALRHQIKQDVLTRETFLTSLAKGGVTAALDEQEKIALRKLYLSLKKACDETEALIKVFKKAPTNENVAALFSSSTGPRSIGVAVTQWKKLMTADKTLEQRLLNAGGADMVHLYETKGFFETTQNKGLPYWQGALKMNQSSWQRGAQAQADFLLRYTGHFRRCADAIKTMAK